jgi:glycosyltransferase involved in cell wall biosynthesis
LNRLCIVTPFPPEEDGLAVYSERFVKALLKTKKVSVTIISRRYANKTSKCNAQARLRLIRIWEPKSFINQFAVWRAILHLHPDVVDIHYGPYAEFGGLIGEPLVILACLLRLSRLKVFLTIHSLWLPHKASERAFEITQNTLISLLAGFYYWSFMLLFLRLFNRILLVVIFSNSHITDTARQFFHLSTSKIKEMVHGTSRPLYSLRKKISCKSRLGLQDKNVFLIFGFIRRDKGIDLAIRSMAKLHGSDVLIVAGRPITDDDEKYLSYLKTLTQELKLNDRVRFDTRFIPEADLANYLFASDFLLLPYTRRVGPSGPFAIAASYGLPVIGVYDREFLSIQSSFVWLLEKADSEQLSHAMENIIVNKEVMIRHAISYASKYCFENISEEYLTLF